MSISEIFNHGSLDKSHILWQSWQLCSRAAAVAARGSSTTLKSQLLKQCLELKHLQSGLQDWSLGKYKKVNCQFKNVMKERGVCMLFIIDSH